MSGSGSDRSWKFIRSLQWSLLIGLLCGMAFVGLTYSQFMLELEQRQSGLSPTTPQQNQQLDNSQAQDERAGSRDHGKCLGCGHNV